MTTHFPPIPQVVFSARLRLPHYSLTEEAALWISGMCHGDNLQSVQRMVALVPNEALEEQTMVVTAMAKP